MLKVISRVSFQKSSTVQIGGVKLSVVHEIGKEGVLALLGAGDFLVRGHGRSDCSDRDSDRDYTHHFTRY